MMKCPYCDEYIQDGAVKCRYCKEFISKPTTVTDKQEKEVIIDAISLTPDIISEEDLNKFDWNSRKNGRIVLLIGFFVVLLFYFIQHKLFYKPINLSSLRLILHYAIRFSTTVSVTLFINYILVKALYRYVLRKPDKHVFISIISIALSLIIVGLASIDQYKRTAIMKQQNEIRESQKGISRWDKIE